MEFNSVKEFNKFKGDAGETIASVWLEENGFKIIEMNYFNKHGEIDIIATKSLRGAERRGNPVYHFIEVKMRVKDAYGRGREAVTPEKQKRIRNAAQYYLIENGLHDEVFSCFDVVEISGWFDNYQIEYLENCF